MDAQFCPPQEQLAFALKLPGEADFLTVFEEPLPIVLEALKTHDTWDGLLDGLPDISLDAASDRGWLVSESGSESGAASS